MERLVGGMEQCFEWFRSGMWKQIPNWEWLEDLTFGTCWYNLFGTRFKRGLGATYFVCRIWSADTSFPATVLLFSWKTQMIKPKNYK